jgi:hypothetical protein
VCGHMERSQAILALHIGVGVLLQQQTGHLDVAILGCNVQWSEALLKTTMQTNKRMVKASRPKQEYHYHKK